MQPICRFWTRIYAALQFDAWRLLSGVSLTPRAVSYALVICFVLKVSASETIVLKTQVDPTMVGGLTVQIGDKFMDLSISSKIASMKVRTESCSSRGATVFSEAPHLGSTTYACIRCIRCIRTYGALPLSVNTPTHASHGTNVAQCLFAVLPVFSSNNLYFYVLPVSGSISVQGFIHTADRIPNS